MRLLEEAPPLYEPCPFVNVWRRADLLIESLRSMPLNPFPSLPPGALPTGEPTELSLPMPGQASAISPEVISNRYNTRLEVVNPDFLPRVRMGRYHVMYIEAALDAQEPVPEAGTDDDWPAVRIPVLGRDRVHFRLVGSFDEGFGNTALYPRLISTYENDEIHRPVARYKVKRSTNRRRLTFAPTRVDDDGCRSKIGLLGDLLSIASEDNDDIVDWPPSNLSHDALEHRRPMDNGEILGAVEPLTGFGSDYNSNSGHGRQITAIRCQTACRSLRSRSLRYQIARELASRYQIVRRLTSRQETIWSLVSGREALGE